MAVAALGMASLIFLAWRRRVRHQRAMPRGGLLLPGGSPNSSTGSSPNPNTYANAQPEMSSRNHLLSSITTDPSTLGTPTTQSSRPLSLLTTHYPQSTSDGNMLLAAIPPIMPSPYEQHERSPTTHQQTLARNASDVQSLQTRSTLHSDSQPYTYEESARHSTFTSMGASAGFVSAAVPATTTGPSSASVGPSAATGRESLQQDMVAFQKRLEAEEEATSGDKSSRANASGDNTPGGLLDPPPSYSRANEQ